MSNPKEPLVQTEPAAEPNAADRVAAEIKARLELSPDGLLDAEDVLGAARELGLSEDVGMAMLRRARDRNILRPEASEVQTKRERDLELVRARTVDLRRAVSRSSVPSPPPFTPFGCVLVRAIDFTLMSSSALEVVQKTPERPSLGLVIAVGDGFKTQILREGNRVVPEPGQIVLFSKYGGQEVLLPEGRFWCLFPAEVYGIYSGTVA